MPVQVIGFNAKGDKVITTEHPDASAIKVDGGALLVGNMSAGTFEAVAAFQAKYWASASVLETAT